MKMDIQTVGFNADSSLTEYAQSKTEGLMKYFDRIVGAEIYLKLVQDDKEQNKVAEIKLNIPGNDLFASSQSGKFEGSVNDSIDKLKGQLRKLKTKLQTH